MNVMEFSSGLADAVERTAASVVRVEGRRRPSSGLTGFGDGIVVTAAHTLHRDEGLQIGVGDAAYPATVLGFDPSTDVAVLKVEAALPGLTRREGAPRVGELVLALGRPNGGIRATLGAISYVGGPRQTAGGGRIDHWVEVDGTLPPGFSGGPLIDASGAVIGMNSSALGRGGGTIPLGTLDRIVASVLTHGGVRRGWLGVAVQPANLGSRKPGGRESGLLVSGLAPGGPAEQAGILLGDVLLDFAGAPVADASELLSRLDGTIDTDVPVRLVRGDTILDLSVKVGGRAAESRRGCRR